MTYTEKLKDPRWQKKRLEVMQRHGFKCKDCGSTENTLHVHHCGYRGKTPWETPIELLLTVCESCHKLRQSVENEARESLDEWFARSSVSDISDVNISSCCESDYESSIRWFLYAESHPECRNYYEEVTGLRPKWELISRSPAA